MFKIDFLIRASILLVLVLIISCATPEVDSSKKTKLPFSITIYYDGRCEGELTLGDGSVHPIVGSLFGAGRFTDDQGLSPAGIAIETLCSFDIPAVISEFNFYVFFKDNFAGFEANYIGDIPIIFGSQPTSQFPWLQERDRELELKFTEGKRNIYEEVTYRSHDYVPSDYSVVTWVPIVSETLQSTLKYRYACSSLYSHNGSVVFSAANSESTDGVYARLTGIMIVKPSHCF